MFIHTISIQPLKCQSFSKLVFSLIPLMAMLALSQGCGGSDSGPEAPLDCRHAASGSNQVGFECLSVNYDHATVVAVLNAASEVQDVQEVLFDVTFDSTLFRYVPGSAVEGSLLNADGHPTLMTVNPLQDDPGRLLVSLARQGIDRGITAPSGRTEIVFLEFVRVGPQGSDGLVFQNAGILDHSRTRHSIGFENNLILESR